MSLNCVTCGAPSPNNGDGNWDDVTETQWAAMFHARELLAAMKAVVQLIADASDAGALYGKHDVAWQQRLEGVLAVIEKAEGRGE